MATVKVTKAQVVAPIKSVTLELDYDEALELFDVLGAVVAPSLAKRGHALTKLWHEMRSAGFENRYNRADYEGDLKANIVFGPPGSGDK